MRLLGIILLAGLVGCGSDHSLPPGVVNVAGNWTGKLQSTARPGDSGDVQVFATQVGTTLNGPRAAISTGGAGSCDVSGGTMTGTIDGGKLTMTVIIPPNPTLANLNQTVALTGQSDGNTISGTYNVTDGCTKGDAGTFQMSRAPSITSSRWTGNWTQIVNAPYGGSAAANLAEDAAGKLTGTLTLNNNICDDLSSDPLLVTGTMTGLLIDMQADTPTSKWKTLEGQSRVDISGKKLQIDHFCVRPNNYLGDAIQIDLTRP